MLSLLLLVSSCLAAGFRFVEPLPHPRFSCPLDGQAIKDPCFGLEKYLEQQQWAGASASEYARASGGLLVGRLRLCAGSPVYCHP